MPESDWVELSLAGDLDAASRVQYRQSIEARTDMPTIKETLEDFLPTKHVPAPPCPGFGRLAAIMSIEPDDKAENLATYKPVWSGARATANNEEQRD